MCYTYPLSFDVCIKILHEYHLKIFKNYLNILNSCMLGYNISRSDYMNTKAEILVRKCPVSWLASKETSLIKINCNIILIFFKWKVSHVWIYVSYSALIF